MWATFDLRCFSEGERADIAGTQRVACRGYQAPGSPEILVPMALTTFRGPPSRLCCPSLAYAERQTSGRTYGRPTIRNLRVVRVIKINLLLV